MKKAVFCLLCVSALLGVVMLAQPVKAERILTEAQIEQIRGKCTATKSDLDRLHSADALLRNNLGRQYDNILTQILSSFNSRIAINKLYDVRLTETTSKFDMALAKFRNNYRVYEESLTNAIKIDCKAKPIDFYEHVQTARANRKTMHDSVLQLNQLLKQYQVDFTAFRSNNKKGGEA